MITYTVRMEFNVISTDLAEVEITANSKHEAINIAINKYNNDELELDYYASNNINTTLDTDSKLDWIIEIKD